MCPSRACCTATSLQSNFYQACVLSALDAVFALLLQVAAVERMLTDIDELPQQFQSAEILYLSKNCLTQLEVRNCPYTCAGKPSVKWQMCHCSRQGEHVCQLTNCIECMQALGANKNVPLLYCFRVHHAGCAAVQPPARAVSS